MNGQEIIEMAKQAGCIPRRHPEYWEDVQVFATPEVLQAFAKLVAAKKQEQCAQFCEQQYEFYGYDHVFAAGIRALK